MSAGQAGDWVVVSDDYTVSVSEVRADGTSLAFAELPVGQFIGDLARAKRRATLMAAAPKLLEALQMFVDDYECSEGDAQSCARVGRAAIAIATGEQQ